MDSDTDAGAARGAPYRTAPAPPDAPPAPAGPGPRRRAGLAALGALLASAHVPADPLGPDALADDRGVRAAVVGGDDGSPERPLYVAANDGSLWRVAPAQPRGETEWRIEPRRILTDLRARGLAVGAGRLWVLDARGQVWSRADDAFDGRLEDPHFEDLGPVRHLTAMRYVACLDPCACPTNVGCGYGCFSQDMTALVLTDVAGRVHLRGADPSRPFARVRVDIPATVRRVSAAWNWACAVDHAGAVWCFAHPLRDPIGLRARDASWFAPRPAAAREGAAPAERVPLPEAASHVWVSRDRACAALRSGRVWCWRHDASAHYCGAPAPLFEPPRLAEGRGAVEAALPVRAAMPWENPADAVDPFEGERSNLRDAADAVAVFSATDAVEYACWAGRGHLRCTGAWRGDGTRVRATEPRRVRVGAPVRSMIVQRDRACALDAHGAVWCWGRFGPHDADVLPAPTRVASLEPVDRLVRLGEQAGPICALRRDRALACWGLDAARALRARERVDVRGFLDARLDDDVLREVRLPRSGWRALDGWGELRPPGAHPLLEFDESIRACVGDDGVIRCGGWGIGFERVRAVSGTRYAGCAVGEDGGVSCWGAETAEARPGFRGARGVAYGPGVVCAWDGAGAAWCVGDDRACQLGDGACSAPGWGEVVLPTRARSE